MLKGRSIMYGYVWYIYPKFTKTFQVPKMEENPHLHISCMFHAYVRENPTPKYMDLIRFRVPGMIAFYGLL